MRRLASCMLLLMVCAAAQAQNHDRKSAQAAAELRPSGPVTVKADHAEWVQDSTMKYSGHVSLQSDTLKLSGETMDVKQLADGNFEALITGTPAVLDHLPQPGASGPTAQPVHAEAKQLSYASGSGTVTLSGQAHLKRGSDEVHGATIGYEVPERRVRAAGDDQGQVTIIFTPPVKQNEAGKSEEKKAPPAEAKP